MRHQWLKVWSLIRPVAYELHCGKCERVLRQRTWRWSKYVKLYAKANNWSFNVGGSMEWRCPDHSQKS